MKYNPYPYQQTATQWIIDHPRCALFLDMGLGKTVSTLTAMQKLIDFCEVERVLVVAPKKVAETTWSTEAQKWEHLRGLRVVKVLGSERQRCMALDQKADIYVTGRDNFAWLVARYGGRLPFDAIVIDELTSFKSPTSQRFKAMRLASASAARVVGLTGTPAPNGLADLWAQLYCIDQGERLGRSVSRFREAYFTGQKMGHITIRLTPRPGAEKAIRSRVADICLSMQARDYLSLPDLITHTERVELSPRVRKLYAEFEREKVLEFQRAHATDPTRVMAANAAALMNKLSQMAGGAVYDEAGGVQEVHSEKLDRLAEIIESAAGQSVLVFYQYKHEVPRIVDRLKRYNKNCEVRCYKGEPDLIDWNAGRIDVLLAHPASTAFGLNMQQGGHYIVWLGTGWNLELYQQANARLHRQGQRHPVTVYRLLCADTVDERAALAIEDKRGVQQGLLDGLNYLLQKHGAN